MITLLPRRATGNNRWCGGRDFINPLCYSDESMATSENKRLIGKVALITGGSRGIGRAIAAAYADQGAQVFVCGRNDNDVRRAVDELRLGGAGIDGASGNIADPGDVRRIVRETVARFGTIDVLVNNASLLGPRVTIAEYDFAAWRDVLATNLDGLFLVTHQVLPIMLARHSGAIINLTSGVGRVGKAKWGAYAVSKAALEGFTQVLADEVSADGIRVNSVNPAATRTEMRAQAYPAEDPTTLPTPESIMPVFVYLASDESRAVSGQALNAREWLGK
jgi:NAD(P)-dependent dehydrogenase (short-subunit alcohol dehydrogenase family)